MGYTSITMDSLNAIKADIYKQGKRGKSLRNLQSFPIHFNHHGGEYNCGCSINPRHFTINKLCPKHFKMLGELP